MKVQDDMVDPLAMTGQVRQVIPITTAVSLTSRPFARFRPGAGFQMVGMSAFCAAKAGAVTVTGYIVGAADRITAGTLAIHSTPEQFAIGLSRYITNSIYVEKAAATALTFTLAHVVTASTFGIILVQADSSGAISTKVPATTQAYASAALALAALPAADTNKIAIGYIRIAAKAATWTANTDDLTNGSDLTTATFVTLPVTTSPFVAAITPLAMQRVAGVLSTTAADIRTSEATEEILLTFTTDGTGALTNGSVAVAYRPFPMHGEVG